MTPNMTPFLLHLVLTLLKIPSSLCDMRKTIRNVKYPFPRNWTPFAHYTFHVGDKKEATACWKDRTFSYNEGFGSTVYIMRECPEEDLHCEDNFVWGLSIGWKTGM